MLAPNPNPNPITRPNPNHAPAPLRLETPPQAIVATVSDDETWKVWSVPDCDLLMSGEGHRDWVSGVDFHPHGTMLATGAGDSTVKVWDILQVFRQSVSDETRRHLSHGKGAHQPLCFPSIVVFSFWGWRLDTLLYTPPKNATH